MKITKVAISNYRNLDGVEIYLDPQITFLVGENNLGKSNLLSLLKTIFSAKQFIYDDFSDPARPIEISLSVMLDNIELGVFSDIFDSTDPNRVSVGIRQRDPSEWIEAYHEETGTSIDTRSIRTTQFLLYDSLRKPEHELDFSRKFGVGRVLNYLVSKYTDSLAGIGTILNQTQIEDAVQFINKRLTRLRVFRDYGYSATWTDDSTETLSRILRLKGTNGLGMASSGYGVQYFAIVTLAILERLLILSDQKLVNSVFENTKTEKKSVSILIGFDEPEIHLHPHLQRSLVEYLTNILSNKDEAFLSLLKECFGIDEFLAQAILVTHSPYVVKPQREQISRLSSVNGRIKAFCGANIVFNTQAIKHFTFQFDSIKEAFFSRAVLVVEGETELGAFPWLFKKLNVDINRLGVSIIKAAAKESVAPLCSVLKAYGIRTFGIIDRDTSAPVDTDELTTTIARDFEEELVDSLFPDDESTLRQILRQYDDNLDTRRLEGNALLKDVSRYSPSLTNLFSESANYSLEDLSEQSDSRKLWYLTWLRINKGIILGAVAGSSLSRRQIPKIFRKALLRFARGVVHELPPR